jgi:hypothetical protein
MDAADAHNAIEGAKRLLAAHGYFYLTGAVPDRMLSNSDQFQVLFTGTRSGPLIFDLVVDIGASRFYESSLSFEAFLVRSFLSWREGEMLNDADLLRMRSKAEAHANEAGRAMHCKKLRERLAQAMEQITMPLGRSATKVSLKFNATQLGNWDRRPHRWTKDELDAAIRNLLGRTTGLPAHAH